MWSHRPSFTIALTGISRALIVRDRLMGWSGPVWPPTSTVVSASRHSIHSGASILDAIYVEPVGPPARAAVLLCHGIGETVRPWFPVQQLLAINGVASLLFDYSGYGKSTGIGVAVGEPGFTVQITVERFQHAVQVEQKPFVLGKFLQPLLGNLA